MDIMIKQTVFHTDDTFMAETDSSSEIDSQLKWIQQWWMPFRGAPWLAKEQGKKLHVCAYVFCKYETF